MMTEKEEQNSSDHDSNVELDPALHLRARTDAKETEFTWIIRKLYILIEIQMRFWRVLIETKIDITHC